MFSKKELPTVSSVENIPNMGAPKNSKFEKKHFYGYIKKTTETKNITSIANTMQRPKSNLVFEEKGLSQKKSEEIEENVSFTNTNLNKYRIYFVIKNDPIPLEIECVLQNECLVIQAISQALKLFNQEITKKAFHFTLNENSDFWEFRFSKKNGSPKSDYPALDNNNIISNVGSNLLCLCCTDASNGIIRSFDSSNSNCSIESDLKFNNSTRITNSYSRNSLPTKTRELDQKNRNVEKTPVEKKSHFCFFTLFCL